VIDLEPPVFSVCPTNRTLQLGTNCSLTLPNLIAEIVATDNCGSLTITQAPPPSTRLNIGTNLVTFRATDSHGNNAMCQSVIVLAANPPLAAPDNIQTTVNTSVSITPASVLANDSSPDSRPILGLAGVNGSSTNAGLVTYDGTNIIYQPPANYIGVDAFRYTNSDCAGLIGIGLVTVAVNPIPHNFSLSFLSVNTIPSGSVNNLRLQGLPGFVYRLQRASDLTAQPVVWTSVAVGATSTNAADPCTLIFHDTNAPSPCFYRAKQP
jgi:hypothetical protein